MSFSDTWVVDRTLFDYFHQGSCSCCGANHALLMDSALLRELCSDMDTDDAKKQTAETCPWPTCMKEALHKDMVAVRSKLRARLPYYQEFVATHTNAFSKWWSDLPLDQKQSVLVMPIEEVLITYTIILDVKRAYSTLVESVVEQVKRFRETDLPCDGPTACERAFENVLEAKRGAFLIQDSDYFETNAFMEMVLQVGGATLLPKSKPNNAGGSKMNSNLSFRSDRRLMRLVIFRYFLDRAIRQFLRASTVSNHK